MFTQVFAQVSDSLLSQASTPDVMPADIELLKSQLAFLKGSYGDFVETVKIIFIVLGVAGAITAFFFGKSFHDLQVAARDNIKEFMTFLKRPARGCRAGSAQGRERVAYMVENEARDIIHAEVRNIARIVK